MDMIRKKYEPAKQENESHSENKSEKFLMRWSALENEVYERNEKMNSYTTIVLLAIIAYAVYTNSPIMAITFVLIGVVGYMFLNKESGSVDFAIAPEGVIAGKEIYEFENIKSFWIFYEPNGKKVISLHIKNNFLPFAHIPIGDEDPVAVRSILVRYIPEIKQEKSLVDTLEKILGF